MPWRDAARPGAGNPPRCFSTDRTRYVAEDNRRRRRPVFHRGKGMEDEGAIVVFPAVIKIVEITPARLSTAASRLSWRRNCWDFPPPSEFLGSDGNGIIWLSEVQASTFALARIVGAVVTDGDTVNAGFGKLGKDSRLVAGADVGSEYFGFGRIGHRLSPCSLGWRRVKGEDRAPAGALPVPKMPVGNDHSAASATPSSAASAGSSSVRKAGRSVASGSIPADPVSSGTASTGSASSVTASIARPS